MKKILVGIKITICSLFVSSFLAQPIFSADKTISDPYTEVVNVFSAGTNTTHSQIVQLNGIEDVYVSFHCPANGVTVGTATFGLEESLDGVTWGSITATEMTRATNTLVTSITYGSNTVAFNAEEYRGTHTSTFVGTLGTSTALTNQFYHIKPYGAKLRFQCTFTASGTDTAKYKTLIRRGSTMNKF